MRRVLKARVLYAAEAVLIAAGILPLFMLLYPLALLAAPAPFLAGYAAFRPTWWAVGPREPRRYARQYVHLAACVSAAALAFFAMSLTHIL